MGKEPQRYRLKLSRLDFVSLVDEPAQPNAKTLLIKRKGGNDEITASARFVKSSDELGLAFFWAFTSTNPDGSDHFDLHDDTVDGDFMKAALAFMEGGGAVDEMHDSETKTRVVFAFPMTPDVAKAFSIETKTTGLMVAIKVTEDQLAKLKDGTYTGVSIAGAGTREPVRARKSADKRYLTDEVAGHQHEVNVYDGGDPWMTDATAEGAQSPHRHTVSRSPDGTLTVLADSGHTHTMTEWPRVIVVEEGTTVIPEDVAARAPSTGASRTGESPRLKKSPNVNLVIKETAVDPTQELADLKALQAKLEAKIADLETQLGAATTQASLTDGEKAHLATLAGAEAKRFVALEKSARLAEVEKANEVAHTCVDGTVICKSDGALALKLAKQSDDALKMAQAEKSARETVELTKRATETIGKLAGPVSVHTALLKAAESIDGEIEVDGKKVKIADEAVKTLKAANDAMSARAKVAGFGGSVESTAEPLVEFQGQVTKFAEKNGFKDSGLALEKFLGTPEGKVAKAAYDETRAYAQKR